jgi:hypothetical protein
MQVRITHGPSAGMVAEFEDSVAQAHINSGRAELIYPESAAEPEAAETPEKPARGRRKAAAAKPETR